MVWKQDWPLAVEQFEKRRKTETENRNVTNQNQLLMIGGKYGQFTCGCHCRTSLAICESTAALQNHCRISHCSAMSIVPGVCYCSTMLALMSCHTIDTDVD